MKIFDAVLEILQLFKITMFYNNILKENALTCFNILIAEKKKLI